ncbi:MAG: hypothetical protein COT00_05375 [Candidatus Omnitrophica bacterium CG07_land_8_20_14_0_80_50_8]|nr:MAG: hypothetical protein COT00_05375 [Candidatus Omnitrophica bacterium CG07_land_8_20_14_0_80_50_8]
MPFIKAEAPFIFKTQLSLVETMGLKARDLVELNYYLKEVPESSVYHHTHHFLQQHQYLTPEPPNDFAYWIANVLQEDEMGEKIAAIDTVQFGTLEALRGALVGAIEEYLAKHKALRKAPEGEEFHFMKSIRFILPTVYSASDLGEFLDCLTHISPSCLYNHIFGARLRPPLGESDFSNWLKNSLGETELAGKIERLDPYTYTMEGLRKKIIHLIEKRLERDR